MTIGGAVLFNRSNTTENYKKIVQILEDKRTTITMLVIQRDVNKKNISIIFKLTIPPQLSSEYFMNIKDTIKEPTYLIIKLLGDVDQHELNNEIAIHNFFGSQTNIMPFCPSFLYHEQIKSVIAQPTKLTPLGKVFYNLLQSSRHKLSEMLYLFNKQRKTNSNDTNDTINFIKEKYKVQDIIIMESLECYTLYELMKNLNQISRIYTLYGEQIHLNNSSELNTLSIICTYFLATLMALENYSHGDLHMGNVMICFNTTTTPQTIIPQLIDFGKSVNLDDLMFKELIDELTEELTEELTIVNKFINWRMKKMNSFIKKIYDEALKNKANIVEHIKTKLNPISPQFNYIVAVIVISMCIEKNNKDDSMFNYTFNSKYNYKGYLHLYNIYEKQANKYHNLIYKLIQERKNQKQILEESMEKAMATSIATSIATSMTKPIATSTQVDTIESKPSFFSNFLTNLPFYPRPSTPSIGGRYLLNIRKNKRKKTRKQRKGKKTRKQSKR